MKWIRVKFDEGLLTECDYYNKLANTEKKYITEFSRSYYYGQTNRDFFKYDDAKNKEAVKLGLKNKFASERCVYSKNSELVHDYLDVKTTRFTSYDTPESILIQKQTECIENALKSELSKIRVDADRRLKHYYRNKIVALFKAKLKKDLEVLK